MNQPNQGSGSSSGAPMKRKRGRPRKDQTVVQGLNVPAVQGMNVPAVQGMNVPAVQGLNVPTVQGLNVHAVQRSDNMLRPNQTMGTVAVLHSSNQTVSTTGNVDNMVGKVVTGVVEGTFNAGYLLKVRVDDSDTCLRGLVFLPGRVTPVTADNDVVPNIKMTTRKELPVPILNPQAHVHGSVPAPVQCSKQSFHPEIQVPVEQVQPTEVHSGISVTPENQSASTLIPIADLSRNGTSITSGGILPGISATGRAAIISELACGKTVKQGHALHELDASTQVKESSADGGATKHSEPASQTINLFPTIEITDKELRTAQPSLPSMPQLNEVIHQEPNTSNIEFNLIPVSAEPKSIPSEQTSKSVDNLVEDQALPKADLLEDAKKECAVDKFVEEQALPKADLLEDTKKEGAVETLSEVDTSIGKPSAGIAGIDMGSNLTLETSQSESLPSEHVDQSVPSESKVSSEGRDFREKSDPQNLSSVDDVNKVDFNQPTESLVKSVESENQIGAADT